MSHRRITIGMVIAVIATAIIVGALIGGVTQTSRQEIEGVADESPLATAAADSTPESSPAPAIDSPAPAATLAPTSTLPPESSPTPERTPESSPTPEGSATTTAPPVITYTVQPGDILFRVAQRFNTTPEAIAALNPGINPDSLTVGDVLTIPTPAE